MYHDFDDATLATIPGKEPPMTRDVADMVAEYLSDDPMSWAKLASNTTTRRLELLLLREILLELRKLNLTPSAHLKA